MEQRQKEAIATVIEFFDRAEVLVKEIERLDGNLSIPSINQLRYVGYHLARALCRDDSGSTDAEIEKARNHCQRAIYDAHEIGIIYQLETVKAFSKAHSEHSSLVIEVVPTYPDDLAAAEEAAAFINDIQHSHRDDREAYYRESEPHYNTLKKIGARLRHADPLVRTKAEEQHAEDLRRAANERRETRRFVTTVLLAAFGLVVTIALTI